MNFKFANSKFKTIIDENILILKLIDQKEMITLFIFSSFTNTKDKRLKEISTIADETPDDLNLIIYLIGLIILVFIILLWVICKIITESKKNNKKIAEFTKESTANLRNQEPNIELARLSMKTFPILSPSGTVVGSSMKVEPVFFKIVPAHKQTSSLKTKLVPEPKLDNLSKFKGSTTLVQPLSPDSQLSDVSIITSNEYFDNTDLSVHSNISYIDKSIRANKQIAANEPALAKRKVKADKK